MESKTNENGTMQRGQKTNHFRGAGPHWVLILGGALLTTLTVKLGCQLKQAFDNKRQNKAKKENRKSTANSRSGACELHTNLNHFAQNDDTHYHCPSDTEISRGGVDAKQPKSPITKEPNVSLPLVGHPVAETNKDVEGVMRASSPGRLELPWKPFHHSNRSESSCISESGSDIYSKREVIQKLRQQLKRRDEMIMEMQARITYIQTSLRIQMAETAHLQSQVDSANNGLFNSDREVQRLRKVIAEHIAEVVSPRPKVRNWHPETTNGLANGNGYADSADGLLLHCVGADKVKVDGARVEILKTEVGELMQVIEGKDFLLQSYKEQKLELCSKIKELQLKLNSQVPNIF